MIAIKIENGNAMDSKELKNLTFYYFEFENNTKSLYFKNNNERRY